MEVVLIKQEPKDYLGIDNGKPPELLTETVSSSSVCNDESTVPYDHYEEVKETLEIPPEPNYDELGEFCFESDHPALKSNTDYKKLLETIFILEAQRAHAIKDLDRLHELQEEALSSPVGFVENLQKGKIEIPKRQKIHQLPVIDWSKYALSGSASAFGRRQLTRLSAKVSQDFGRNGGRVGKSTTARNIETGKSKCSQYWTAEEQKRLEELLVQFPPEEVESRRWEKIANCLENRTPLQVASRVQKYFIKLMKAGIPIPGRMPNPAYLKKPRRSVIRRQPSTFLVSHQPPVYMPDDDEFSCSYSEPQMTVENSYDSKNDGLSDEEDINSELRNTEEYQEIMLIKKILREKERTNSITHFGYRCSKCKVEPIVGVRWHCTECKASVNFCTDCVVCDFEFDHHISEHHLESVEEATTALIDKDYTHAQFLGNDYNYLDPNYMPAMEE